MNKAPNGQSKAYKRYTTGAYRQKQKREGNKTTHPPSSKGQPIKKC